jgi:fructose-specific phosphotransferase system IIC component
MGCVYQVLFFCGSQEGTKHLFISCHFARLLWKIIHITYYLPPTNNIANMFENWLNGVATNLRIELYRGLSLMLVNIDIDK